MGLYDHYQIRGGRRFKVDASPVKNSPIEKTPVVGRNFNVSGGKQKTPNFQNSFQLSILKDKKATE